MAVENTQRPLKRLSSTVKDPVLRAAISALEDKVEELDARLRDAAKRLTDGGL